MTEREAQVFRKLQSENNALREQLESLQNEKSEKKEAEVVKTPPPTKEQFDRMGYHKRVELKQNNLELYNKYSK